MPNKPNPNPPKIEKKWVSYETSRYLAELLRNERTTIGISQLWPDLERILLDTQREENDPAVCKAVGLVLHNIKMFADQGKLDTEYLKTLTPQ